MPHPERAFYNYKGTGIGCGNQKADGRPFFESAIKYICRKF
jgi:phosphoribosylformylglycinamidine (FGAM) synthase-like amidotransferase family enzyme